VPTLEVQHIIIIIIILSILYYRIVSSFPFHSFPSFSIPSSAAAQGHVILEFSILLLASAVSSSRNRFAHPAGSFDESSFHDPDHSDQPGPTGQYSGIVVFASRTRDWIGSISWIYGIFETASTFLEEQQQQSLRFVWYYICNI
jgi:hypothetical protein